MVRPDRILLSFILLLAFSGPVLVAQEDEGLVGSWRGGLQVGGGVSLTIVFNISQDAGGAFTGTMDSPDQGAVGIPLTSVSIEGNSVTVSIEAAQGTYTGTLSDEGDQLSGIWNQGPASLALTLVKGDPSPPPERPQEPGPPYPYSTEEVTFRNTDAGIDLAGTLTIPDGLGPFPGVVLVSGSGPQDRNESLMGHKPFLVLADHLSRRGIAVLRFDDRGVGSSGGEFGTATSEDFTEDALAGVLYLEVQDRVAENQVGIVGHSEGGLIAPLAAIRSERVAYIVMLAGPGVPGIDILVAQGQLINRAAGMPELLVESNSRIQLALADIVRREPDPEKAGPLMRVVMRDELENLPPDIKEALPESQVGDVAINTTVNQINSPWFRFFLNHDPRPVLEQVSVPVLAIFGEKDLQVPPELNVSEIEAAFERGNNEAATVRVLAGLNHLFQQAESGAPSEYQQIEETFNQSALELISSWILEHFPAPKLDTLN
ncbi:MAG: alpha/beta fold hydrolase [bacterium]|jgi:pimeloyl-ACP methyl ester carboxylesterase|nr:alpha/beta hydrolase [Gemmatimonadota bacterium]HIL88977.1 alpha/beta hydrolase [Gemmatimonadota bacterium]